jgi:hypothetical protein
LPSWIRIRIPNTDLDPAAIFFNAFVARIFLAVL